MRRDGRTPSMGCTMFGVVVVLVLTGAVFVVGWLLDDDPAPGTDAATTSTALTSPESAASTTEPPATTDQRFETVDFDGSDYTITYRVETFSATDPGITTEIRSHRFPFESTVRSFQAEPDARGAQTDRRDVHVLGGFETGAPGQQRTLFTTVPGPPADSGHVGGDLDAAVEAGLVEETGRQLRVVGRDCDVYRTRAPLGGGHLQAPTSDDFTDVCVSPDGLVLREVWTRGGEVFRRRTAVEIDEHPGLGDDAFELTGFRMPERLGGGRVRRVTDDSTAPDVPHLLPTDLAAGLEHRGRYVYVADNAQTGTGDIGVERVVSLVDVYVSDRDVLVVENGGVTTGTPSLGSEGFEVAVEGRDDARARLSGHGTEVVFPVADGRRFARLTSTLPLDDLVAVADDLADHPGTGEVTPLDDNRDVTDRLSPEDVDEGDADPDHTHDGGQSPDHDHGTGETDHTHG